MTAALGHAEDTARPLLRTSARGAIASDTSAAATAAADALGRQAAAQLRDLGADAYLAAAPRV
jgi:hydroxymethylbilane synthase